MSGALMRAAASSASVVLDDALGDTDPERLRALGEVLARAAEGCQVIVLTSDPRRYSAVEAARVVTVE